MYNFTVLHEDLIKNAKIKELLERIQPNSKVQTILSLEQLGETEVPSNHIDILIIQDLHIEDLITLQLLHSRDNIIALTKENNDKVNYPNIVLLQEKFLITGLSQQIEDITKKNFEKEDYIPISFQFIKPEKEYPADVYLQLKKDKHIKVIKKGIPFDTSMYEKLKQKKITFLYIEKADLPLMNDHLYERKRAIQLFKKKFKFTELNAVETLHTFVSEIGFDPKVLTMVEDMHKSLEEKFPQKFMKNLFARFKQMEGSFLYNHSYLTSVLALQIGKKLSWMNFENREKVYLGCILHDLGHKHKDNALKESLSKSQLLALPKEEQEEILNHPTIFATKLAQVDNIHQDVIKIVKDHHGIHGDESYPKQIYPTEINLIFALFILSHEFVLELFKANFKIENLPKMKQTITDKFNKGPYKKIMPEFLITIDEVFLQEDKVT